MAQSNILKAKNLTGTTLIAGKVVYISGFDEEDQKPLVAYASNNDETKMPAVGTVRENIENGDIGIIKISGPAAGFNTSDASSNDNVYVGQNGGIVFTNEPTSISETLYIQKLGTVTKIAGSPNGQIQLYPLEVKPRIRHIDLTEVTENQHHNKLHAQTHEENGIDIIDHSRMFGLSKDSHQQYSLVDGSRAFTRVISGITPTSNSHLATKGYVDGEVGSGLTGSGTSGYVAYWTGSGSLSGETNLYWDATENRLGINGAPTTYSLEVTGDAGKTTGGTSWQTISDKSVKKEITPLINEYGLDVTNHTALEKLTLLRGVLYKWLEPDKHGLSKEYDGYLQGFVSQEIEEHFPEWINIDSKGLKWLNMIGFEAYLVEALKEVRKRLDDYNIRLLALENS